MGKAFVAKLAREGARDPEALAAWIGRKKHGRQAFAKLAAKGRKDSSGPSSRTERADPIAEARARREAAKQRLLGPATGNRERDQQALSDGLREMAAASAQMLANRPAEVSEDVAALKKAAARFEGPLMARRLSVVSDEQLAEIEAVIWRLALQTDDEFLSREEKRELSTVQRKVRRERQRRLSQRR